MCYPVKTTNLETEDLPCIKTSLCSAHNETQDWMYLSLFNPILGSGNYIYHLL